MREVTILTRVTMTISQIVDAGTPPERKENFSSFSLLLCTLTAPCSVCILFLILLGKKGNVVNEND